MGRPSSAPPPSGASVQKSTMRVPSTSKRESRRPNGSDTLSRQPNLNELLAVALHAQEAEVSLST